MSLKKRKIALATACVFILLAVIYAITANNAYRRDYEQAITKAELTARVYTGEFERDFYQGISLTKALEDVIIGGRGEVHNFSVIAENLMEPYISSIQIAPGGVVTDIYPMKGNEAGLIDLMNDPVRGPVAAYGIEHDVITMQGPFELKQGGSGIAVRDPVFLTDEDGNRSFWGFAIAIIKAPEIFQFDFESLESFGYDYRLSTTISPISDEYKVVTASADTLIQPVEATFQAGECTWKLEVARKGGWSISRESMITSIVGGMFVLLLTVTFAVLLVVSSQRRQLRVMAQTDPLTGLMNRKGRVERIDRLLKTNPKSAVTEVFLDIDDFKIINDLYGHDIGDEALKNLANNLLKAFEGEAVVSRTGGDEFGVFIPGRTAEEAEPLIHAASAMDQTFTTNQGKTYTYTISMGYSDYPAQAKSREELARNVDCALYNVKLSGKHGCQRFVPGMIKKSREQLGFSQSELLKSLPGSGFICHAEDHRILYANDDFVRLFDCVNLEDFNKSTLGLVRNLIHPDDYERVMAEQRRRFAGKADGDQIRLRFRIVTKTGSVRNMIAQARLRHHDTFGDLYFVTCLDLDEE